MTPNARRQQRTIPKNCDSSPRCRHRACAQAAAAAATSRSLASRSHPASPGPGVDQGAHIVVRERLTPGAHVSPLSCRGADGQSPPLDDGIVCQGPLIAPDVTGAAALLLRRGGQRQRPLRSRAKLPAGAAGFDQRRALSPEGHVRRERDRPSHWTPAARRARRRAADRARRAAIAIARALVAADDLRRLRDRARSACQRQSGDAGGADTRRRSRELQVTAPLTGFGTERCFLVRPVDIVNGFHVRGPASPVTCVTPADTFPPSPPKSLAGVANADGINLIWDPSDTADVAGYLVLRSRLPDATLAPAMEAPISDTHFTDRGVRPGVTYAYVVVAVDKAGNRSDHSNRIEETAQ